MHTLAGDFADEVRRLTHTSVSTTQWATFLDKTVPTLGTDGTPLTGRAKTTAEKKRSQLESLYRHDLRAAPWAGTALGVLQAVNTYEHHQATIRGTTRSERNMLRTITGDFDHLEDHTLKTLTAVLA